MATAIFTAARSNFIQNADLSQADQDYFKSITPSTLQQVIDQIQQEQVKRRSMRYMSRLSPFLIAMEKYGKVIETFVNTSDIVAFVWGPMKFILITASAQLEALDSVLDAYQAMGERMPLLIDYEEFPPNEHLKEVLGLMYTDILEFHRVAYKYFKQRFWKQCLSATWRGFSSKIKHLTANMERHSQLLDRRANVMEFQEMMVLRQKAEDAFEYSMKMEEGRQRDEVRQWLCSFNNDGEQEAHREKRAVCGNAGRWLLDDARFKDWFSLDFCSTPMLWMTGIPGAGKTILVSMVVDELLNLPPKPNVVVAYFYCKFGINDRNSFVSVARSMLAQLLVHTPELLSHMYEQASLNQKGGLPTLETARALLRLALDARRKHGTTYLIIDGIDECDRKERCKIAEWFQEYIDLLPIDEKGLVRCLFVSQDDGVSRNDFGCIPSFKLTPENTSNDIRNFVSVWHQRLEKKFGKLQDGGTHITNLITARAQGMFLFARLMVEYLADLPTREDLDRELHPSVFPDGLDQAYDRIKHRMLDSRTEILKRQLQKVLGWVACAPRPLKWREIQAGVSIDLDEETLKSSKRLLDDPKSLFAAFIEIDSKGVVELIHRTAREYLFRCKFVSSIGAHCSMAILSMSYLNWPQLEKLEMSNDQIQADLLAGTYSFLDYASACWSVHLAGAIPSKSSGTSEEHAQSLDELRETLPIFVDTHWSASSERLPVPKKLQEDLARLFPDGASDRILQSMAWSRRQLDLNNQAPSVKEAIGVWEVVASVRSVLESLQSTPLPAETLESLKELYGEAWFKCPRVSCRYYHEGFSSAKLRDGHVNKHDRPFLCLDLDCDKAKFGFATDAELKKHLYDLHGIDMLPDATFPDFVASKLEKMNLETDQTGRIKCPQCEKSFTRAHNLKGHIRSNHSGEKPFKCGQCEKTFPRSADCTRHERQHEGKKFTCFGQLDDGTEWGCKAEFVRRDKREDHFRKAGRKCIQPLVEQKLRLGSGSDSDGDKLMSQDEVMLPRFQEFLRICGLGDDDERSSAGEALVEDRVL